MIGDSQPWRRELYRLAGQLERRTKQSRWTEASSAGLEREMFMSAYIVRKLIEAKKLSTSLENAAITVTTYPRRSNQMDYLNWHRLDDHYDFDAPQQKTLAIRDLCNQFIHSYVFMCKFSEKPVRFTAVLIASDRGRQQVLYEIETFQIVELLRRVADDDPSMMSGTRDPKTWEWITYRWDLRYEAPTDAQRRELARQNAEALRAFKKWNP